MVCKVEFSIATTDKEGRKKSQGGKTASGKKTGRDRNNRENKRLPYSPYRKSKSGKERVLPGEGVGRKRQGVVWFGQR